MARLIPRESMEVLVEALTDESGTDYCVSIALGREKVSSKWMRSERKAEKLAAAIKDSFSETIVEKMNRLARENDAAVSELLGPQLCGRFCSCESEEKCGLKERG